MPSRYVHTSMVECMNPPLSVNPLPTTGAFVRKPARGMLRSARLPIVPIRVVALEGMLVLASGSRVRCSWRGLGARHGIGARRRFRDAGRRCLRLVVGSCLTHGSRSSSRSSDIRHDLPGYDVPEASAPGGVSFDGRGYTNAVHDEAKELQMPEITNPKELFSHELGDILYVERELASETLPKLIDEVQDEEFKAGLEKHLERDEQHVKNVEQVFELFGEEPKAEECPGFEGLEDGARGAHRRDVRPP